MFLLEKAHVATVTGSAFGCPNNIRISYAASKENITEAIGNQVEKVTDLIQHVHLNIFENHTGKTNQEEFETQVMGILGKATSIGGKIGVKNLDKNNNI